MATVTERIRLLFDIDDKAAVGSFGNITRSIQNADGARGKMHAGLTATGNYLKANMAEAAVAAGAALVAFGAKAVIAFQDTALEAGKVSSALGINVEDASRLMEVAGDLGVDMGSLQGAMQRFNKEVGSGKVDLKEFGTDLVYAKDGSVDAYQSFINAATAVGAIKDPTDRAREAQRLFGRSYGEIALMMEMSAEELRAALAGVSEEQVIDEGERRKAEELRDAMDTLRDRFTQVQLAVGEGLAPVLTDLAAAIEGVDGAAEQLGLGGLGGMIEKVQTTTRLLNPFTLGLEIVKKGIAEAGTEAEDFSSAGGKLWSDVATEVDGFTGSVAGAVAGIIDTGTESRKAAREVRSLEQAWADLKGEIDDRQAFLNVQTTFDDLKAKGEEAWSAAASGAADAEQKVRDYESAQLSAKEEVIDYLAEVLKLPPERSTKILAALDEGNLAAVEAMLANLTRNRNMSVSIQAQGGVGYDVGVGPGNRRASGGPVHAGETYLVGEQGPELLQMGNTSGNIIPNHRLGSSLGGGGSTVINITTNADPNSTKAALRRWSRRNGPGLS